MNVNSRLCGAGKENLKHILNYRELQQMVKTDLRSAVEELVRGEVGEESNVLENNFERPN